MRRAADGRVAMRASHVVPQCLAWRWKRYVVQVNRAAARIIQAKLFSRVGLMSSLHVWQIRAVLNGVRVKENARREIILTMVTRLASRRVWLYKVVNRRNSRR